MSLSAGTRLGPYEVVSALGAGGMGEVYRARDTKLNREVALKILPELFATDAERLARFTREAQTLASLNHPNIAAIYGIEETPTGRALIMELVEGEDLSARIARGPLPVDEAIAIANQIAEALSAAHGQGIIHRDLKPANVKVRPDGTVKVLDFGLAKAVESAGGSAALSQSPTITTPAMTGIGMILGTAAYMSPEQARGRPVDKRSDVWSFGCVLFEMLTGKRAFEAEDVSLMLASVMMKEPDWGALPPGIPAHLRTVVKHCLEKERHKRLADIAVAQFLINEPPSTTADTPSAPARPAGSMWRRAAAIAAMLVVAIGATGFGAWEYQRLNTRALQVSRFTVVSPPTQPLLVNAFDRAVTISPDGRYLVYVVGATREDRRLMIRPVDRLDATPLRSVGGRLNAVTPFFDPGSQWIGFAEGDEIKKVSVTGGPAITICKIGNPRGASWGPDNTIFFATDDPTAGLYSVSAAGGEPKVLTKPDAAHGERNHLFPSVLPGGRAVLFTITSSKGEGSQVAVLDLKTGAKKILVRGGSQAEYVEAGYLVYAAADTLRAVRFDLSRLDVLSDPVPVVEQAMMTPTGAANFAISRGGTLVYVPGTIAPGIGPQRTMVWVNRQGREEPVGAPPRSYLYPRLSPDGTRLALDIRDQENDIWIWDLNRRTLTRLTFDPLQDRSPVWSPDSRRVFYTSQRAGVVAGPQNNGGNIFSQAADGTGTIERLTNSPSAQYPFSISPDGTRLLIREDSPKSREDLAVVTLEGKPKTETLLQTPFNERNGEISPDGRWVAYESNESGQYQIYVRPFPKVDGGRWQISTAGGTRPLWARSGRELFYLDSTDLLTAVPVQTAPAFNAGNPVKILDKPYVAPTTNSQRPYDVSADGQRFLMIKDLGAGDQQATALPSIMVVVMNWFEELKQRMPVN